MKLLFIRLLPNLEGSGLVMYVGVGVHLKRVVSNSGSNPLFPSLGPVSRHVVSHQGRSISAQTAVGVFSINGFVTEKRIIGKNPLVLCIHR